METVLFEKNGTVGVVTLNKPPHNLLEENFLNSIVGSYQRAVEEGCRSILLRSGMRHFCAGADVEGFNKGKRQEQDGFERLMRGLEDVPIPVVAAVHGAVLGGGLEMALTADVIIAADTASIGQAEATLGLHPLLGGVQRVTQRVGVSRAKEIAMLGRRLDPVALERWGLINQVVKEADLPEASLSWATQLASGPTVALGCIKMLANLSARGGIAAADAKQVELNNQMWASEDQRRGLKAFLETGFGSAVFEGN